MKTRILLWATIFTLASCSFKNTKEQTQRFASQFSQDNLDFNGNFHWNFKLMGGLQESTHTFFSDSIVYNMKGKVYSTTYTMHKLSYNKQSDKWIGQDRDSIVYVLFFKEKTDSTVTLYKHKCKNKGLEEALAFAVPKPDATEDHGWNIYTKTTQWQEDQLPILGTYNNDNHVLQITDQIITLDQQPYTKLSYHAGERRWTGKHKDSYLQLFFKDFTTKDTIAISKEKFTNLEKAYKTKYNQVQFTIYTKQ